MFIMNFNNCTISEWLTFSLLLYLDMWEFSVPAKQEIAFPVDVNHQFVIVGIINN